MHDTVIEATDLRKSYGTGPARAAVLQGVSVGVAAGEFVSVTGPSGSGKSTLLNLLAGIDVPDSGRVVLCGEELSALSDDDRSDLRLRRLGIVFQSFNLFASFSVLDNVVWPLEFLRVPPPAARERARAALDAVGLEHAAFARRPVELSGGEQQRVAIARALVTDPAVILADEPTGNLDAATSRVVLDLLRRLNQQRSITIVMVTHSTLAATYGHRTIELQDGRITRDVRAPMRPVRAVPPRSS